MLTNAGLFLSQEVKYTYNRMSNFLGPSLRERREAIVREHIAAENAHDISRAIAPFTIRVTRLHLSVPSAMVLKRCTICWQACSLAFLTFMSTCPGCTNREGCNEIAVCGRSSEGGG